MHDLLQLLYGFLIAEGISEDTLDFKVLLVKELLKKGHLSLAKFELNNSEDLKQKYKANYNFYLNNYLLESYGYNIENEIFNLHNKKQAETRQNLLSHSDGYLLLFFITELICDYVNTAIYVFKYNLNTSVSLSSQILSTIDLKN